jgi:hypothetical protein
MYPSGQSCGINNATRYCPIIYANSNYLGLMDASGDKCGGDSELAGPGKNFEEG